VAAPVLVPVLFGDRWSPAIAAVQVLCLSGPALAASRLNGNLFEATGRASWTLLLSLGGLVVLVPAFLVGVQHGLVGVAWAYTATAYAGVAPTFWFVRRCTGVAVRRQLANLSTVVVASVALVAAATAARLVVERFAGSPAQLVALVVAGALAYLGALLVLDRPMLDDIAAQLRSRGASAQAAT
jgi:O-antigen/teichoic acid export membrane protein